MSIEDDARVLAKAIMDEWWEGHFGDYDDNTYHCCFCSGKVDNIDVDNARCITHDIDCPVLVALDVLT